MISKKKAERLIVLPVGYSNPDTYLEPVDGEWIGGVEVDDQEGRRVHLPVRVTANGSSWEGVWGAEFGKPSIVLDEEDAEDPDDDGLFDYEADETT